MQLRSRDVKPAAIRDSSSLPRRDVIHHVRPTKQPRRQTIHRIHRRRITKNHSSTKRPTSKLSRVHLKSAPRKPDSKMKTRPVRRSSRLSNKEKAPQSHEIRHFARRRGYCHERAFRFRALARMLGVNLVPSDRNVTDTLTDWEELKAELNHI